MAFEKGLEVLDFLRGALVRKVREDTPDLTNRQMAILLTIYMDEPPHTVRGLAKHLNVSKPVVTRALDTLSEYGFVKRVKDENDKRSVMLQRTVKGSVYLRDFVDLIEHAKVPLAAE